MSYSADALKEAIELEKKAIEKYKAAINSAKLEETKETLRKYLKECSQHVESASWIAMAEAGELEGNPESAEKETGATKLAAGKCPFSGQLKEMGFDMDNMSKEDFDMSKLKDMFNS